MTQIFSQHLNAFINVNTTHQYTNPITHQIMTTSKATWQHWGPVQGNHSHQELPEAQAVTRMDYAALW